jgi:hypothetical protein
LVLHYNQGTDIYNLSNDLSNQYNIHGNLASNGENNQYFKSEDIAYFLNIQYYGTNMIIVKYQKFYTIQLVNHVKSGFKLV